MPVIWAVAAVALQLARQRGIPAVDTVWAEDGRVFLSDALNDPFGAALVRPYAGYMLAVPRLVAAVAALNVRWAAILLGAGSAILVGLTSLYVADAARSALSDRRSRWILAAVVPLLPAAGFEALNNVANVQWFFLFACFWALARPTGRAVPLTLDAIVVLVTALTTPLVACLLPVVLFRAWSRSGGAGVRALALSFGLAVQLLVVLTGDGVKALAPSSLYQLPALFGLRVLGALAVGEGLVQAVWQALGWWMAAIALMAFVVLLALGGRRIPKERRSLFWLLLLSAVLLFCVPAALRGTEHLMPEGSVFVLGGSRYVVAPMLLFVAAILMLLETVPRTPGWRGFRGVLIAGGIALVVSGFSAWNLRSYGPRWSTELSAAARRCREGTPTVRIPIAPPDPTRWYVTTDCARLHWGG